MRDLCVAVMVLAAGAPARADGTCAIKPLAIKAPRLVSAESLDAARTGLLRGSVAMEREADIMDAASRERAFAVAVRRAYEHGGAGSRWDASAVFQLANNTVVVLPTLARFWVTLPPSCGMHLQDAILDVRITTVEGRQVGVVRVRRVDSKDKPALPAVSANHRDPECARTTTYRIEDYYVDLGRRKGLLVLAGAYVGPVYEEHAPPLADLDTVQLTRSAITVDDAQCGPFAWRP